MSFLKGRTNRSLYWLCVALIAVILCLLGMFAPDGARISEVVLVLLCVPRLHDIGRSGWLVAIPLAGELLVSVGAAVVLPLDLLYVVVGVVALVILGLVVWLGLIPGQPGPNRFGDPPPPGLGRKAKAA